MTMTDPIADMLTRLRNANQAYHDRVSMPYSKIKANIAEVLKSEGYIAGWSVEEPEEGTVGKTYGAKVTPTIYIVNKDGVIAYTGAVDNGQGMKIGDVNYVSQALNEILAGQTVSVAETKATGCGVKYK